MKATLIDRNIFSDCPVNTNYYAPGDNLSVMFCRDPVTTRTIPANYSEGIVTPNITADDGTTLSWNSTMNTTTNVLSFTWIIKSGRVD